MSDYFIAAFIAFVIIYGLLKKCNCLGSFAGGVKEGATTVVNMYVYILGFVLLIALIENCGIVSDLERFRFSGIVSPIIFVQMLLRPFSGSSSLAMMVEVYEKYGPDSFTGMLTTFIHTITDSTIYITVFYLSAVGIKKYGKVIWIGLLINILGFILSFLIVYFFL
jgi:spore maturation protein B